MDAIDERIERLINRKLDGELTPEEQLELDKELLRCPAARALYESYREIDGLVGEVISDCAGYEAGKSPIQADCPYRIGRKQHNHYWMYFASVLAASLAFVIFWNTPEQVSNSGYPTALNNAPADKTPVADSRMPTEGKVQPTIKQRFNDAGVWRVKGNNSERVNRLTDRNVIVVPGEDGEIYLLNLDRIREVRLPTREDEARLNYDPI